MKPSKPIIFIDIDGVLNRKKKHPGLEYCGMESDCVERFNCILDETDAEFIVSSSWRYLVLNGSMTLEGFRNLLFTHGVHAERMIDINPPDEEGTDETVVRIKTINAKINEISRKAERKPLFFAIDDLSIASDLESRIHCKTAWIDSSSGLQESNVEWATYYINSRMEQSRHLDQLKVIEKVEAMLECLKNSKHLLFSMVNDNSDKINAALNGDPKKEADGVAKIMFPEFFN